MISLARQRGISLISLALIFVVVIVVGLIIVRISGSYYQHFTLNQLIETTLSTQSSLRFDEASFRSRLKSNMQVNRININLDQALTINQKRSAVSMVLDYEDRVHLFANIDVVLTFYNDYEL